jgi:aspartate/methionine/tyrosine aminotransferase
LTPVLKEPLRIKDNSAVWAEFFDLGIKYKCVSLGQGAPDLAPPKFLKEAVTNAMD